jgi:DNA-binding transcriptional MerR regulator
MQRYAIGELAERTGLTVKAIRFYSDRGIVPAAGRTPAGHRYYDHTAVARLRLVRTLRELGLGLTVIRRILDRELVLADVATAHADAIAVQIRVLRLRQVVLAAAAERGSTPEEMDLMHRLAKLSEQERRALIDDFLAAVFDGVPARPEFPGVRRTMTPELPEDPAAEQVEAWVELAALTRDPEFRALMRQVAELYAAERDRAGGGLGPDPVAAVRGGAPVRPEQDEYLRVATDPRRERYMQLLSTINGWG